MDLRTGPFVVAMAGLVLMLADVVLPGPVGLVGALLVVGAFLSEWLLRRRAKGG